MQSEMPDNFHELYSPAKKEHDLETVAELVDRILDPAETRVQKVIPDTQAKR